MTEQTVDATQLQGVSTTTLWTLYNRASEADRPDGLIHDPVAINLLNAIDYPFRETFGEHDQSHALRARCFDVVVNRFLREHPEGTVVALGEGLETGFWRTDNGKAQWLSVDLPDVITLREKLLPTSPRLRNLAISATDPAWIEQVDTSRPVFVNAQGLLPYLQPGEALHLIRRCADAFPGGRMIFDAVPPWHSKRSMQGTLTVGRGFPVPPLPFGFTARQAAELPTRIPGVASVTEVRPGAGRGWRRNAVAALGKLPVLRDHRFAIFVLEFANR